MSEFVRRTSSGVRRLCAGLVDPASADDLTQDTYVRAVRSLEKYRGDAHPTAWLATIARRVCAEEIARRQRARALGIWLAQRHRDEKADDTGLIDLADALERLIPERREAFLLTAVLGFSYSETAAWCGVPVGTIRSRVARARTDLIEALRETGAA
jgi:RNA polymerase sigma-70 factor (ECF subfamily)